MERVCEGIESKDSAGQWGKATAREALKQVKAILPAMLVVMLFVGVKAVMAGNSDTQFQQIYETILSWAGGYLGKTIAVGMFITGMGVGLARQSLMSIVIGTGGALAVQYTPTIIDSIVTALM